MAKDHFVPRHYLRRFAVGGSEEIMVAKVSPYRFVGKRGIGGQCQEVDFYEGNTGLEKAIWTCENDLSKVLVSVAQKEDFSEPELVGLRWLAATLLCRSKKAANAYKVFLKRIAYEVVQHGIDSGKLPPPPDGNWSEDMIDFKGVPGLLIKNGVLPCALEMQTLASKLLKAPNGVSFITSDNPVLVLNQFSAAEPHRNFAGFSKSGFQLLMPISPAICLIAYDATVYKVGSRKERLVAISASDVAIVNALQLQSSDEYVYFHDPSLEVEVQMRVALNVRFKVPVQECLQTLPGPRAEDEILHFKQMSVKLPKTWDFCRMRRHVNVRIGDRRNPAWTALIDELIKDFEQNPNGGDMHTRIKTIVNDPNSLKNIRLR